MVERKLQLTVGRSIRTQLLVLLLGLTTISVLTVGYLGVNSVESVGKSAQRISAEALRTQAEDYLRQVTAGDAQRTGLILRNVENDAESVARYAAGVFEGPDVFAGGTYWQAENHMFIGPDGQYVNGETDVTSVFVPDFAEIDEELLTDLELGAHLDPVLVSTYESDPNTVAIYLGTEQETTRYYPNVNLGAVLPPDFQVTQRPWYVSAAPESNPERAVVWSPVYVDATGKGLMVTAAAQVYTGWDEFVGVVGIDFTLENISASIEATRLLGSGYSFLIDNVGHAIALPQQGYQDILGRPREPDEFWADLSEAPTEFAPVLAKMMAGATSFDTLEIGGRELFVAYAPLESAGWSLANVVEAEVVLKALTTLQEDLDTSTRSLVLARILPVGGGILVTVAVIGLLLTNRVADPIRKMAAAAKRIGAGQWDAPLPRSGEDEIGVLSQAFATMIAQLRELIGSLEQRVSERTADLEQRSVQLKAAAEVAREAAAIRDVGQLLDTTARLISDRFDFYHAGIFLVDEAGKYAVLRAAPSEGGQRMLERGHRLKIGEVGIVGWVAGSGQPRIALDVGQDAVFFDNPDLPLTRSEMALPLKVRDQVVGVLDVQSTEAEAFSEEDVEVLQTMADQVALAIENARLLEESQRALRELQATYGEYTRAAWESLKRLPAFEYDQVDVTPVALGLHPGVEQALSAEEVVTLTEPEDGRSVLVAPLRLRDQVIGAITLEETGEGRSWTKEEIELIEEVNEQVALALENARLFEETRRRTVQLEAASEVARDTTAILDVDQLLDETVHLISEQFGFYHAGIFLVDERGEYAMLRAASSEGGRRMLEQDHKLAVGKIGIVGYVTATGEPRIALDVGKDAIHFVNPDLPNTRSEMALPLISRGRVIGALDVQSTDEAAFSEDDVAILRTLADQLATAIENARLYEQAVNTAEQLKEMDRLKNQFLANMSHELRTPLNSIIGFSRVILKGIDGPLTDMQRTDLQAIYDSGQYLLRLINDILDISKIQAGKMELSFKDTDLREIIEGVMSTAIALIKDKSVELQQSVPQDLPTVHADARRIRQALLNLVGNAARFTEEGFICVEAEAKPAEVVISVTDSGRGIPAEKLETIFEEFTQVDGSSTRRAGGTGLGLAITRHFVELHSGRIWVDSTLGVGSTFHIALPIESPPKPPEEEKTDAAKTEQPGPEPESDQRVVLCVDDDEGVITLFRRYLNKRGYQVVGLTDGTAVVEQARQLKPFAITLDVMMPDKDGWQVIQELQADLETRFIPVIMCTIVSDKERGLNLGASDYLFKPILEQDLLAALERLDRGGDHYRVLVVDDHPEDRNLLRRMIEAREGYEVVEAAGGQEAITLVRQVQPHVIILDLLMPEVDGFAVLEAVKADEATRSIPIIVVTAKDLSQEERDTLNNRVEVLLQKGLCQQQELLAEVAAALEQMTTGIFSVFRGISLPKSTTDW